MEPTIRYTRTSDGVRIAYWTVGEGPLLVHMAPMVLGFSQAEWRIPGWRAWYEAIASKNTVVRYDTRGAGLSDRDVTDFSLESLLLDVEAVANDLGTERLALLAANWAGPFAIAYAALHPERVSHLLLWCAQSRSRHGWSRELEPLLEKNWELYTQIVAHISYGWSPGPESNELASYMRESFTPQSWRQCYSLVDTLDIEDLVPQVQAPALVLHRRGFVSPDMNTAGELASRLPNGHLALLEGSSVAPYLEDMQSVADAVHRFLAQEPPSARSTQGHAGLVTVLFTDIAQSTALTQRLGDSPAQELVRAHNGIVREALSAHGGDEVKHTGDGIMASFPTASGAIECAIAIQRAVEARGDADLRVHVGLNAGEPVAEDADLYGTAVQLARRICDHGDPGEILTSNVVRELAAGKGFLFAERDVAALRGFDDPVRLFEVRWRE
jgi:class 3 adenylate cyclase